MQYPMTTIFRGFCAALLLAAGTQGLTACAHTPAPEQASLVESPTVDSNVLAVLARMQAAGYPQGHGTSARFSTSLLKVDDQGRLHLLLTLEAPLSSEQAATLQALGWSTVLASGDISLEGWVPAAQVSALAAQPFIHWVAPAWPARRRAITPA